MAQDSQGVDILRNVLRNIVSYGFEQHGPTATEMMRAALALAELDDSITSDQRRLIREIINGFGNRVS